MAVVQNQLNDIFTKQLGRPATDYEVQKFSTASPQTLATLKDTYGKLNPNSLSDYLTSIGQDNSIKTREDLARKYGISNVYDNERILASIKKGEPTTTPVSGSIVPPATKVEQTPQEQPKTSPDGSQSLTGTITGATQQPQTTPEYKQDPQLGEALKAYQDTQSQISQIDKALAGEFEAKKQQIRQSGGIVNEAQLLGESRAETNPLVAQRRELVAQQANLGKTYQTLLASDKEARAMAEKQREFGITSGQKETQLGLNAEKVAAQQKQFEEKLIQTGYKKVADYSDGTKVGEHFVNLSGKKVTIDPQTGAEQVIGTGTPVGSTGSTTSGSGQNVSKGKVSYTDFASVPDAPTDANRNIEYPGTAGKTYGAVYEDAVTYAETGKYQKMGMSSKPSTKTYDNAVKQKASNIAASLGMTEDGLRTAYASNKTAISKLVTQKSTIAAFENKAKAQIDMILNGYTDPRTGEKVPSLNTSVSRTDYPLVNGLFVKGKMLSGDTNAQLLSNALITFSNEYAKIMGGGTGSASASSDSARKEAEGLISTSLSEGTLDKTLSLLQKEMDTTIEGYDKQIKENSGSLIGGGKTATPKTINVNNQTYNVGQTYSDGTNNWVVDEQGNWSKQ